MHINKDIIISRRYRSKLRPYWKGDVEWGAIIRKISSSVGDVVEEVDVGLTDGEWINQWVVRLPKVNQHLFVIRTPYANWITTQKVWLKEAFKSESDMENFLADINVKMQNKMELSIESLIRGAMVNDIALTISGGLELPLVTIYNAMTGNTIPIGQSAMFNPDFMRWATGYIRELGDTLEFPNVNYNLAREERFSPLGNQNLVLLARFVTQLQTTALYSAFNEDYLKLVKHYTVPMWQGQGNTPVKDFADISTINITDGETPFTATNIIGFLHDDWALGAYRKYDDVLTTPINARGRYWNTFFHANQLYFNAKDEQGVALTLN